MLPPTIPSEGVIGSLQRSGILLDDALQRRWDAWQEKGRARDRLVRQRIVLIAAIAAIALSIVLEFLSAPA